MSDIAVVYHLHTNSGDIYFNGAGNTSTPLTIPSFENSYFITAIRGLRAAIRNPQWDNPQAHGGLPGRFRKSAAHIIVEGEYLVQESQVGLVIQQRRNEMDEALTTALDSIMDTAGTAGTLSWTPYTRGAKSLSVFYEQALEDDGVEQKTFVFGLYAATPL